MCIYTYICVRVGIFAYIYVCMFPVSKSAFVSCMMCERVTRLWIRMYVLWYKIKSRHALCTGKIDREREREQEGKERKRCEKIQSRKERMKEMKTE